MKTVDSIRPPEWVAHADWGTAPGKRWLSAAQKRPDGGYLIQAPRQVENAARLLSVLRAQAGSQAAILLGFDFPIGLPRKYTHQIGQTRFLDLLPRLGGPDWPDFYRPAEHFEQISTRRPFYPNKPGGTRQRHLIDGLGMGEFNDLRRQCEFATPDRRAAAPLFWTLGGQQVGKAAIAGWQAVLAPAIRQQPPTALIWPFDGLLARLLAPGITVIAETYPAEFYRHLSLNLGPIGGQRKYGKRSQASRKANAEALCRWSAKFDIQFTDELAAQIRDGFGPRASGEDPFDALIGVCGLINLILNDKWLVYEPAEPIIREMEGWILGLSGRLSD